MARALVGASAVELDVTEPLTLRELLGALAGRYPQLIGNVVAAGSFEPIVPNLVLLDGRRALALDDPVSACDRPCLLFLPSGG